MKKNFFYILVFIFLSNCAGFEFVYKDAVDVSKLKEKTNISISGDNSEIAYAYIINKIGLKNSDYSFELLVNSKKTVVAKVVEKDGTASKFDIKIIINYNLINSNNNCQILNKEITTTTSYDSKSAGYSFGTDLSENKVLTQNIHSNIDEFLVYVVRSGIDMSC